MSVEVTAVRNSRELAAFARVPALLRSRTRWTVASEAWVRELLNRRTNPFYRHADRQLLLARKDGRLAGRIAAHVDHLCNRVLGERMGTFGLLDCEPHPRVVKALFDSAERWLAAQGASVSRGPLGPSMRQDCGLLVDGYAEMPMPGMGLNSPDLPALVERAGYGPARDLFAYRIDVDALAREVADQADLVRRRPGLVVRSLNPKKLADEQRRALDVLNDLPDQGRACSPWSEAELRWTVARLRPGIDSGLVLFVEVDGRAAGLGVAIRNVREPLRERGPGNATLDAARVAAAFRLGRIRTARIAVLAVRRQHAEGGDNGLHALLLAELLGRLKLYNVEWAELSLVDPTDAPLLALLEATRARRYKTYRVYEKRLTL